MIRQNLHIPQGYKPSPLGIIPEDWEVKKVKDVSTIKGRIGYRGYTVDDIVDYGNGAISLSPSNIVDGKLQFNSVTSITWEKYYESPEIMLCNGDIVMVKTGSSFGKVAFVDNLPQEATINPQFVIINNIKCDNKWLCYLFDSDCIQKNVHKIVVGGAIPTMSQEEIANFRIAVPPQPEQQRIVSVLSLWDTAIAKQTALIEKLTLRKRGLMQQLLTGKKRLKGFDGEWKRIKFKEIFQRKTQTVDDGSSIQVLSVTKEGIVSQKEYFNKEIASDDTSKYLLVEKGDLAMSGLNFWMGSCHILTQYEKGIISPAYKVFSIRNGFSIEYIVNFVQGHNFKSSLLGSSVIGASIVRRNLDLEMLEEWTYLLPSLPEQQAISNILNRADKEIEIQKQKLAAMQEQKKGLMQVLLTGKRRII